MSHELFSDRTYVMDRGYAKFELFFRHFKHILGCRHLLSHSQNGLEIQVYCAIIACMLVSLWTGEEANAANS